MKRIVLVFEAPDHASNEESRKATESIEKAIENRGNTDAFRLVEIRRESRP